MWLLAVDWGDFFLDIVLPETDRGVFQQWGVMMPIWIIAIFLVRKKDRDIKHFVWGVCLLNFAWFMARMIH